MKRLLLQVDDRGRITIPVDLRKEWTIEPGDYIVIDPDDKNINKANIFTDEELKDPKIIKSLLKLGEEAKDDFYKGKTTKLNMLPKVMKMMNSDIHITNKVKKDLK